MDDTTKKLLKGMQSPTQQLLDAYDKTGIGMLQKELKKLESPLKEAQAMHKALSLGQGMRDQIALTRSVADELRQDTLTGVESVLTAPRDMQKQMLAYGSAIDGLQKNAQESMQWARDLRCSTLGHDFQELAARFRPAPWLAELHRNTTEFTKQLAPALEAWRNINEPFDRIARELRQFAEPFRPLLKEIQRMDKHRQRMEKAGWLPHTTTPFDRLEETDEQDDAVMLEAYYRENWQEVKQAFLESLQEQDIDNQAKAVFVQALEAHGHGLYSLIARALFPEIERVARIELHRDEAMAVVTSQKTLREKAKTLTLSDHGLMGYWDYELYKALNHIYDYCNTVEHASAFALLPVPNRHATIHGHVVYDTLCSSMNALIVTDFVFRLITAIKQSETEAMPVAATA
ncbi:MAG: hypothetical protein DI582_10835 [Azospirillum brasilense]|nr:MAG: hypothetical protein DI582_10835 [Azospirillum brasilense]